MYFTASWLPFIGEWKHNFINFYLKFVVNDNMVLPKYRLFTTYLLHTLSLFPVLLLLQTCLCSQLHTKHTFPSRHLSQHTRANSHAYQICQLANGRAGEQQEIHIKRPWFQPESIQHRNPAEDTSIRIIQAGIKKASSSLKKDWTAAISRRASTFATHQDGQPVPYLKE